MTKDGIDLPSPCVGVIHLVVGNVSFVLSGRCAFQRCFFTRRRVRCISRRRICLTRGIQRIRTDKTPFHARFTVRQNMQRAESPVCLLNFFCRRPSCPTNADTLLKLYLFYKYNQCSLSHSQLFKEVL